MSTSKPPIQLHELSFHLGRIYGEIKQGTTRDALDLVLELQSAIVERGVSDGETRKE